MQKHMESKNARFTFHVFCVSKGASFKGLLFIGNTKTCQNIFKVLINVYIKLVDFFKKV